ncbi:MAG: SRPBCC domain-containing protein [Taibaiella sp.]|nr:SRPBCC domain-containing protein [Taibaiella sp.]
MSNVPENHPQHFTLSIIIEASAAAVWEVLTMPILMKEWMAETPIEIETTWQPGSQITISGPWYKTRFENKGTVLCYEPYAKLSYTHLSSLSRLPDDPGNHTIYEFFLLSKDEAATELTFSARQFVTSAIYHHLAFYWRVTLHKIKQQVEAATQR